MVVDVRVVAVVVLGGCTRGGGGGGGAISCGAAVSLLGGRVPPGGVGTGPQSYLMQRGPDAGIAAKRAHSTAQSDFFVNWRTRTDCLSFPALPASNRGSGARVDSVSGSGSDSGGATCALSGDAAVRDAAHCAISEQHSTVLQRQPPRRRWDVFQPAFTACFPACFPARRGSDALANITRRQRRPPSGSRSRETLALFRAHQCREVLKIILHKHVGKKSSSDHIVQQCALSFRLGEVPKVAAISVDGLKSSPPLQLLKMSP